MLLRCLFGEYRHPCEDDLDSYFLSHNVSGVLAAAANPTFLWRRQVGWVGSSGAKTSIAPLLSRTCSFGSGIGAIDS
jgi:hypothetical protein